jgi:D-arabinose 5-phosphate isomerase GutQ
MGEFWSYPQSRSFAELLIDCDEDRVLPGGAGRDAARGRAVVQSLNHWGMDASFGG